MGREQPTLLSWSTGRPWPSIAEALVRECDTSAVEPALACTSAARDGLRGPTAPPALLRGGRGTSPAGGEGIAISEQAVGKRDGACVCDGQPVAEEGRRFEDASGRRMRSDESPIGGAPREGAR